MTYEQQSQSGSPSTRARRVLPIIALSAIAITLFLVVRWLADTVGLQFAGDDAQAISAWPQVSRGRLYFAVLLDCLLIFTYVGLLWRFTRLAQEGYYVTPTAKSFGTSIAGLVFLVGAFDLLENALILIAPRPEPSGVFESRDWVWPMIEGAAIVKWLGLAIVVIYLVPPLAWRIWRAVPGIRRGARIQGLKRDKSTAVIGDSR